MNRFFFSTKTKSPFKKNFFFINKYKIQKTKIKII